MCTTELKSSPDRPAPAARRAAGVATNAFIEPGNWMPEVRVRNAASADGAAA